MATHTPTRPTGASGVETSEPSSNNRTPWIVAAILAVIVIALVAFMLGRSDNKPQAQQSPLPAPTVAPTQPAQNTAVSPVDINNLPLDANGCPIQPPNLTKAGDIIGVLTATRGAALAGNPTCLNSVYKDKSVINTELDDVIVHASNFQVQVDGGNDQTAAPNTPYHYQLTWSVNGDQRVGLLQVTLIKADGLWYLTAPPAAG